MTEVWGSLATGAGAVGVMLFTSLVCIPHLCWIGSVDTLSSDTHGVYLHADSCMRSCRTPHLATRPRFPSCLFQARQNRSCIPHPAPRPYGHPGCSPDPVGVQSPFTCCPSSQTQCPQLTASHHSPLQVHLKVGHLYDTTPSALPPVHVQPIPRPVCPLHTWSRIWSMNHDHSLQVCGIAGLAQPSPQGMLMQYRTDLLRLQELHQVT